MRLFFAVGLQGKAIAAVTALQRELGGRFRDPGLRWTGPEQLHYTLKFLGQVDPALVEECCLAARNALLGALPFQVDLHGLGAFPSARAPRVLWIGASGGAAQLEALAAKLDKNLVPVGFTPEARPFAPHLTVARVKGPSAERAAARLLQAESVEAVASCFVDRVVLMQSQLSPKGSRYSVVEQFPLAG